MVEALIMIQRSGPLRDREDTIISEALDVLDGHLRDPVPGHSASGRIPT